MADLADRDATHALTLDVQSLSSEGEGVGRAEDGRVAFVPGAVPGDRVVARVVAERPKYVRALPVTFLGASPDRRVPPCHVVGVCGGCPLMVLTPSAQRRAKRRRLIEVLRRLGGFDRVPVEPWLTPESADGTMTADLSLGYRAKVAMPVGRDTGPDGAERLVVGYYAHGSHRLVEASDCPVAHPRVREAVAAARDVARELDLPPYDETTGRGFLRHIVARVAVSTGERMLALVTRDPTWVGFDAFPDRLAARLPDLTCLAQSVHPERTNRIFGSGVRILAGRPYIVERLAGLTFHLSPLSFFQVNPPMAEAMYLRAVAELDVRSESRVVDAHTGVGALALMARRAGARLVRGFDTVPQAVRDAQLNARRNGLDVRFETGRAEDLYPRYYPPGAPPERVILDPPRSGAAPALLAALRRAPPERIVYVSCKPETLARDLARLCARDLFRLERIIPVDLFPNTAHVETIAVLARGDGA